jgi:hypothetical protein
MTNTCQLCGKETTEQMFDVLPWGQTCFLCVDEIERIRKYEKRCELASKEQGIDQLISDLKEEEITATSEQTGGFTMCAYVELKGNRYIYANTYGAGIYGLEDYEADIIQLDEPNSKEVAKAVAQWIKENN